MTMLRRNPTAMSDNELAFLVRWYRRQPPDNEIGALRQNTIEEEWETRRNNHRKRDLPAEFVDPGMA